MNKQTDEAKDIPDEAPDKSQEVPTVEMLRVLPDDTTIIVKFQAVNHEEVAKGAVLLIDAEHELFLAEVVAKVRRTCTRRCELYFSSSNSSKMERMLLTVIANYPQGLTLDELTIGINIGRKAASAYVTSANNWTSKYLYLDGNNIKVTAGGIIFMAGKMETTEKIS